MIMQTIRPYLLSIKSPIPPHTNAKIKMKNITARINNINMILIL